MIYKSDYCWKSVHPSKCTVITAQHSTTGSLGRGMCRNDKNKEIKNKTEEKNAIKLMTL